jgi:hypothetical protein
LKAVDDAGIQEIGVLPSVNVTVPAVESPTAALEGVTVAVKVTVPFTLGVVGVEVKLIAVKLAAVSTVCVTLLKEEP